MQELPQGVQGTAPRQFHRYDTFARELSDALGAVVDVVERPPEEATETGLVFMHVDSPLFTHLMSRASEGSPRGIHHRMFLLHVLPSEAQELDKLAPLGALLAQHYGRWKFRQPQFRGDIYGPKSFESTLAAHFRPVPHEQTDDYVLYQSEPRLDLPKAVALYISLVLPAGV
ncbi:hypothetical protein [Polyangium sp. 15x6]|uniref:hypothetical protein n=1 Tax=Polyangium sp. 15x6 TaxID=3042687 RepID=UPI00249BE3FD|nr:hypothetical protein [Polyangium sp. 15x6]MDI3287270.1 hypothetical protein [Polyangium sp. 15x6]